MKDYNSKTFKNLKDKVYLVQRGFSSRAYFNLYDKASNRRKQGHIETVEGCDWGNLKIILFG